MFSSKTILFSVFPILFAYQSYALNRGPVTIRGRVSGDMKGANKIYFYLASNAAGYDSVTVLNGLFVMKMDMDLPNTIYIRTEYDQKIASKPEMYFPLLITKSGNLHIEFEITGGLDHSKIEGAPDAAALHEYLLKRQDNWAMINSYAIKKFGNDFWKTSSPFYQQAMLFRDSLKAIYQKDLIEEFTRNHKREYVGLYVLKQYGKTDLNIDQLQSACEMLSDSIKKMPDAKSFTVYINGVKHSTPGNQAANFTLADNKGKRFQLTQLKGKYVWIDFWASWCVPCQQAFPKMRAVYQKYKSDGLEIVGISTDQKKDPWLQALKKWGNPWIQLWDNQEVGSKFAVDALPTSYLVDPEGKIIAKEVGLDPEKTGEIEKKLIEIFGEKVSFEHTKNIIIKGQLSDTIKEKLFYAYATSNDYIRDSAAIVNGRFEITVKYDRPGLLLLSRAIAGLKDRPTPEQIYGMDKRQVFLEGADLSINGADLRQATVSGAKAQQDFEQLTLSLQQIEDSQRIYRIGSLKADAENDTSNAKRLMLADMATDSVIESIENDFVKNNPGSLVSLYVIEKRIRMRKTDKAEQLLSGLNHSLLDMPFTKFLIIKMNNIARLQIGKIAPDFTLKDTGGRSLTLSAYRGKIVLIDFWASWCGPCRAENPNVVDAYKKYRAKGFEIIGVSLDNNRQKWLKAINDDQLSWQHVSDLKGWDNSVAKQYEINGVPANFLIDSSGVIIAKNLRGDALLKKLREVFGD